MYFFKSSSIMWQIIILLVEGLNTIGSRSWAEGQQIATLGWRIAAPSLQYATSARDPAVLGLDLRFRSICFAFLTLLQGNKHICGWVLLRLIKTFG